MKCLQNTDVASNKDGLQWGIVQIMVRSHEGRIGEDILCCCACCQRCPWVWKHCVISSIRFKAQRG